MLIHLCTKLFDQKYSHIPSSILTNPKLGTVMCLHLQQAIHIGECQFSLGEKKINGKLNFNVFQLCLYIIMRPAHIE